MSETTAFLAGTAVAGLSALLLLKGGLGVGDPQVPAYSPSLSAAPSLSTAAPAPPSGTEGWGQSNNPEVLIAQLDQQKTLTAQLRSQLDQQESMTDQLRSQLEQQRNQSERVATQLQEQQRAVDRLTLQQGLPDPMGPAGALGVPAPSNNTAIAIWVIGGVFLLVVIVGGVVLLGVVLLSGSPSSRRQPRPQQHYILHNSPGTAAAYPPVYPPRHPSHSAHSAHSAQQGLPTYTLPPRNVRRVEGGYGDY